MNKQLANVFLRVFSIDIREISDEMGQNDIEGWDSLGHMNLILALEEEFKTNFEIDDVIQMINIKNIKEILFKKEGCKC